MIQIGYQRANWGSMNASTGSTKVLLVAMPDSIHVARWLAANVDNNLDVMIFASSPMRRVHPAIRELLSRGRSSENSPGLLVRMHKLSFILAIPLWIADRRFLFAGRLRGLLIAWTITRFGPHVVHTMESQNGGYSTDYGVRKVPAGRRPTTLLTLFGSDIFWFSRFEYHRKRLRKLLSLTDFIQAECSRDEAMAMDLSFRGTFLPLLPVSAGVPTAELAGSASIAQVANRKVIAVKGYGGKWGQAIEALDALRAIASDLAGCTIELYSCDARVARHAVETFRGTSVAVKIHPKFSMTHRDMLELFGRSKLAIALSRSDGLPASMLEAMSQGAFPVQTGSACVDGWIVDGVNGMVVSDVEQTALSSRLEKLVGSNEFLRSAAVHNTAIISAKYSDATIKESAARIYATILNHRNL
jgi:glycosyltransferase involved in cell wall biosynthesis